MNNFITAFVSFFSAEFFILIGAAVIFFFAGFFMGGLKNKKDSKAERRDAVKRSRAVLTGQLGEQIAPFLPGFPANPTEIRFIGKPVDYIAFNGASTGFITDITFIEIKTGNAGLNAVERSLKEVLKAGKVKYAEYRINPTK